jgi:L-malate glycosyltransferase
MFYERKNNDRIVFVVVGRLGKGLIISKVEPLTHSKHVDKVFIFAQQKGFDIKKAEYVLLPDWINKVPFKIIRKFIRFIVEPFQLLQYALKYRPMVINGIYTLPKGLNSMIVGKLTGLNSVVSVIGDKREIITYMKPHFFWKWFNINLLKMCNAVTTKGGKVNDYLIENGINSSKIFTLNGSISDRFIFCEPCNKDIDIVFCGSFTHRKGPDRVLQVISKLQDSGKEIKSVFLGDGFLLDNMQKTVVEKGIMYVEFLGHIDYTEQIFRRAKILIMPSHSEGLSTAMLEAMSCGCVPIVSDVGAMTVAAHHNINSMVVSDSNDIETFYRYSSELLEDNDKWNVLSLNAVSLAKSKYTAAAQAAIFDEILHYLKLV